MKMKKLISALTLALASMSAGAADTENPHVYIQTMPQQVTLIDQSVGIFHMAVASMDNEAVAHIEVFINDSLYDESFDTGAFYDAVDVRFAETGVLYKVTAIVTDTSGNKAFSTRYAVILGDNRYFNEVTH